VLELASARVRAALTPSVSICGFLAPESPFRAQETIGTAIITPVDGGQIKTDADVLGDHDRQVIMNPAGFHAFHDDDLVDIMLLEHTSQHLVERSASVVRQPIREELLTDVVRGLTHLEKNARLMGTGTGW
jgi:hypothetical protein